MCAAESFQKGGKVKLKSNPDLPYGVFCQEITSAQRKYLLLICTDASSGGGLGIDSGLHLSFLSLYWLFGR